MDPTTLKENFTAQLETLGKEIVQLRAALTQRQELSIKLQGAIEAMQLQLGETPGESTAKDNESFLGETQEEEEEIS